MKKNILIFALLSLWLNAPLMAQTTYYGLNAGTLGNSNSYFGVNAGKSSNANASHNSFFGALSGYNITYGISNSFFGSYAGYSNKTGNFNIALGFNTFSGNQLGHRNIFIGAYSGYGSLGNDNMGIGYETIKNNKGETNLAIGNQAGFNNLSGSGNVFIGYKAGYNEVGSNRLYIQNSDAAVPLIFGDFSSKRVGINTKKTADNGINYTLSVNGKIRATEVKVYTGWADYVFANDFKLRPLAEVAQFIQQNKHLPDVPSAAEVEKDGIFVGEMSKIQMQKIEELTLYILELHKHYLQQGQTIQSLQKQIENMAVELNQLKEEQSK